METKEKKTPEVKLEYKNRTYYLKGKQPLTYTLPSRHSNRYSLVWFDPEKGYERELRYATNQKSIFVDEQQGSVTLKHIVFEEGALYVPKEKKNLQEFLSKHPHNNLIFEEYDQVVEEEDQYSQSRNLLKSFLLRILYDYNYNHNILSLFEDVYQR